jgi:uncharacterized OB-fold protein
MLISSGSLIAAIAGQFLLAAALGFYGGGSYTFFVELLPAARRVTGMAIGYNVAYALLGGTAPFVATILVDAIGSPLAPAFYLTVAAMLGLVNACVVPETRRRRDFSTGPGPAAGDEPGSLPTSAGPDPTSVTSNDAVDLDSPIAVYQRRLAEGVLAFQRDVDGNAVFPPRVLAPHHNPRSLTWHESCGTGVIYSVSRLHERGQSSRHLALVDLDEGFRMLSEIIATTRVPEIGDRVKVRIDRGDGTDVAPYFEKVES